LYVHILYGHEKLGAWSNKGAFVAGKKLRAHLGWDTKMLKAVVVECSQTHLKVAQTDRSAWQRLPKRFFGL
jgi:hypothetical protein